MAGFIAFLPRFEVAMAHKCVLYVIFHLLTQTYAVDLPTNSTPGDNEQVNKLNSNDKQYVDYDFKPNILTTTDHQKNNRITTKHPMLEDRNYVDNFNIKDIYLKDKMLFDKDDTEKMNKLPRLVTENRIKWKLFALAQVTKDSVDKQIQQITDVHRLYKNHRLYTIGYVVSFIIRCYDHLNAYYKNIERFKSKWGVLKILQAYERVKTESEFLMSLIGMLKKMVNSEASDKPASERNQTKIDRLTSALNTKISWSYYDDQLM